MNLFVTAAALMAAGAATLGAAERPWQKVSDPTAAQVAAAFAQPPPEYSLTVTWGWNGDVSREVVARDLDNMRARNIHAAIIEAGNNMPAPYLSEGHMQAVRVAVEEAKKRNMRLWIIDEGKYPTGFAGGKFTAERPDLRMQGLAFERVPVEAGAAYARMLPGDVIAAVARQTATGERRPLGVTGDTVNWTAPGAGWEVVLARPVFRTPATRSVNNPNTGAKDALHSLVDYLNPEAGRLFVAWTQEQYKKYLGDEFGETVLGFRGDEPGYGTDFIPWSPVLIAEFQKRKGYDVRPYLAFLDPPRQINRQVGFSQAEDTRGEELRRVCADYWDVWSDLFRDNFFAQEAGWCAANNLEYQLHVEHEHNLPLLARVDGDFFKIMRVVQVPGVDAIWNQVWPGKVTDFPKLASSAAHLFGYPRAMCEAFAAYNPAPTVPEVRWSVNQLLARGINRFEFMFWPASSGGARGGAAAAAAPPAGAVPPAPARGGAQPRGYFGDPQFPEVAAYTNRVAYVLGEGRPAAQIGVYFPTTSFWFFDPAANDHTLKLADALLSRQRDFDFVDEQALASVLKLRNGELVNLSGQGYRAVIVPPVAAMSKAALDNLRAFAAAGGKVIFLGHAPERVADKNFLTATGPADISWATLFQPEVDITAPVLAALPPPDVALAAPAPAVKYTHRRLRDADVYFFFNEGETAVSTQVTVDGQGAVQMWDGNTGAISTVSVSDGTKLSGKVAFPLDLPGHGAKLLLIGPAVTTQTTLAAR